MTRVKRAAILAELAAALAELARDAAAELASAAPRADGPLALQGAQLRPPA